MLTMETIDEKDPDPAGDGDRPGRRSGTRRHGCDSDLLLPALLQIDGNRRRRPESQPRRQLRKATCPDLLHGERGRAVWARWRRRITSGASDAGISPTLGRPRERVDDRALRHVTAAATRRRLRQRALHPAQIGDLAPDIFEVRERRGPDFAARDPSPVHQAQKSSNFIDREAELAPAKDESQPALVSFGVLPVAGR